MGSELLLEHFNTSTTPAPCPMCGTGAQVHPRLGDWLQYTCPRCGVWRTTGTAETVIKNYTDEQRALMSHVIWRRQHGGVAFTLTEDLAESLVESERFPSVAEQAEAFLLWVGTEQQRVGPGGIAASPPEHLLAWIALRNQDDLNFHYQGLMNRGLIQSPGYGGGFQVQLTYPGWEEFERIRRGQAESRKAFMAMSFHNPDLARVYEEFFKPAVRLARFELFAINENPPAGLIDDRLRVEIRRSRFLIADLTDANAGAYWEAGFAEGLGKPVIYTCERSVFHHTDKEKRPHFDTNHCHTVTWSVASAREDAAKLKNTIRATLSEDADMEDGAEGGG